MYAQRHTSVKERKIRRWRRGYGEYEVEKIQFKMRDKELLLSSIWCTTLHLP